MTDPRNLTFDATLDAAIERVLRGERVVEPSIDQGDLQAARFFAETAAELRPSAAARERAMRRIRERAVASSSQPWWWPALLKTPALHLRMVPIAGVLLLGALVGGAYAIPVLLPQIFGLIDPSGVEILQSGRAQELHLTQTAAGVTITADRAYADAHRIVVQFTVTNPPADPGQPVNQGQQVRSPLTTGGSVTLTDSAGRTYRHLHGAESPMMSGALWNGEPLIGIYSFDASQIAPDAQQVSFRLTITELRGVPGPTGVVAHLTGPWTFHFALPVAR